MRQNSKTDAYNELTKKILELTKKILGIRRSQLALSLVPEMKNVNYWGTDHSVYITIKYANSLTVREKLEQEGWEYTGQNREQDNGTKHFSYTHPMSPETKLILYVKGEEVNTYESAT